MKNLISFAVVVVLLLLMALPIIPLGDGSKKNDNPKAWRFGSPHNKRNAPFIILAIVEAAILGVTISFFSDIVDKLLQIDFINNLVSQTAKAQTTTFEFDKTIILSLVVNLIVIYLFVLIKTPLKFALQRAWDKKDGKVDAEKKEQEKKENPEGVTIEGEQPEEQEKTPEKKKRVPKFRLKMSKLAEKTSEKIIQANDKVNELEKEFEKEPGIFKKLFFEGEHFEYGKPWVVLGESILSSFVKCAKVLYLLFFMFLMFSIFFPGPEWVYTFLIDYLKFNDWYLYPFISLIILQEICNTLYSKIKIEKREAPIVKEEKNENEEIENNVLALQDDLFAKYDADHYLRVFPYVKPNDGGEDNE